MIMYPLKRSKTQAEAIAEVQSLCTCYQKSFGGVWWLDSDKVRHELTWQQISVIIASGSQ